jgi:hypothetical protein
MVQSSGENSLDGTAHPRGRATQAIDCGRRGTGFASEAFRPLSGDASTLPYSDRTSINGIDCLTRVEA